MNVCVIRELGLIKNREILKWFRQFQLVRTNRNGWTSLKGVPLFSVGNSEKVTVPFVLQPMLLVFLDKWKTPQASQLL